MWRIGIAIVLLGYSALGLCAYPAKPIRMIECFAPGGTSDYVARVVAAKLTERLGQTVIVDNRSGAGGNVGAEIAARATPDGYTLLLGVSSALAPSRSLYSKLGYDLLALTYVSSAATGAQVLVTHPSLAAKTVQDLVALARSKPNTIRYGSAGVGSTVHLATEFLQTRTGIQLLHVPYKGGGPAVTALTAGEVQVVFAAITTATPMIRAKRVNALAVSSAKRSASLPDVPTMVEAGFPGFYVTSTFGVIAPPGTPPAVVKVLNAEIRALVQTDDVRSKFEAQGLEAAASTPEEWKSIMRAEAEQWGRVIRAANITAE